MSARGKLWLFSAVLYATFTAWYTDFGGPMTDEEVDRFLAAMQENGARPEMLALVEPFARNNSGRQFIMLNVIDLNENPQLIAAPGTQGWFPGAHLAVVAIRGTA